MITDALVTAVLASLGAITSLLPNITLPDAQGTTALVFAHQAQAIFPVTTAVTVFALCCAVRLALYGLDLSLWVYHQVWGSD